MYSKRTFTLGLLVLGLISQFAVAQHYTITDLGPLAPTAINTWGQVVGNYNGHAFIWTKTGGIRDLGTLPGGAFSSATAINDLGQVTGTADGVGRVIALDALDFQNQECSDLTQPFVWTQKKGMQGLGTVGFPQNFEPYWCSTPFYSGGINALGQVVGYTGTFGSQYQFGFLWERSDGMTSFGGSWPPTIIKGISNTGQIVGQNADQSTFFLGHATSWKNDVTTDLGTLGGAADLGLPGPTYASGANGVNDLGQAVGWSTTTPVDLFRGCWTDYTSCPMHAVRWTGSGAISDLGTLPGDTLSVALKINFFGQVIGVSGNSSSSSESSPQVHGRPFIWSERSGMRDLNTLIRGNSKWVLSSATDINVWGQIVGQGMLNEKPHGFLLTPRALFKF